MDDLHPVLRTLVMGSAGYIALVVFLRVSGKRTLSKFNAFDFIVTIALGSTLATVLLSRQTGLAQGFTALALLVGLQFVITWSAVRLTWVRRIVTGEPTLLVCRGQWLPDAMRRSRITRSEIHAALRNRGIADITGVAAVVLETDGAMSILREADGHASALADVVGAEALR